MERRQARPLTRIPTLRFRVTYMEGRSLTNEQCDVLLLLYLRAGDTANSNTYQFSTSVSLSFVRYGSARSLGFLNGFRYPQVPCIGCRTAHPSPQCPCIRVCGVLTFRFYGRALAQSSGGARFAATSSATPSRWISARIPRRAGGTRRKRTETPTAVH